MEDLTLYLVRHGETKWNSLDRLQGNKDSPLTAVGIQQASVLRSQLDKII